MVRSGDLVAGKLWKTLVEFHQKARVSAEHLIKVYFKSLVKEIANWCEENTKQNVKKSYKINLHETIKQLNPSVFFGRQLIWTYHIMSSKAMVRNGVQPGFWGQELSLFPIATVLLGFPRKLRSASKCIDYEAWSWLIEATNKQGTWRMGQIFC